MDLAADAVQFGPFVFILVVFILTVAGVAKVWLDRQDKIDARMAAMYERMVVVVENNSKALTVLCSSSEQTDLTLIEHDKRAQAMNADVRTLVGSTGRIEQKVDKLLERGPH